MFVLLGVLVGVGVLVDVCVGVAVFVAVTEGVGVLLEVIDGVGVWVFVGVTVAVLVGVGVTDAVGVGVKSPKHSAQVSHGPLNTVTKVARFVSSKPTNVQQPMFVEPACKS